MYCVIQEIENKNVDGIGAWRELKVSESNWSVNGEKHITYGYDGAGGRFERDIKKAYKISIHQSYRENGKVKKRQWVIGTLNYYSIAEDDTYIYDSMKAGRLEEINITSDELDRLVDAKLDPLKEKIEEEFQQTEEYIVDKRNTEIIQKHIRDKSEFEKKYGSNTYDYYYDVFGVLRNKDLLEQMKKQYEASKERQRSYYDNYKSNYNSNSNSSYQKNLNSNNKENKDKAMYKKLYKTLAKSYHPDICKDKDGGEMMKLVNQLKGEWGI